MTTITITPILDEGDNTPVFEVKSSDGNATNAPSWAVAVTVAAAWITPAKSLEEIAREWIEMHGKHVYEGISNDIREEAEAPYLTDDHCDTIINLIHRAELTITLPNSHGAD